MCFGGGVQDNSAEVARIEAEQARIAREEAAAERARNEERFSSELNSSYQTALNDAQQYFTSQGLDPNDYLDSITSTANSRRAAVPFLDSAPGTYFDGLGNTVFNNEQDALRNRSLRDIDSYANTGFDRQLIQDTGDDPFINSILEQQYGDSEQQIQNQRARGVLTDGGLGAAIAELTRQRSGARSNLDSIGQAFLEQGRGTIRNTASDARSSANNLRLGTNFDPFAPQRTINDQVTDFFSRLGDQIGGAAPTDLFDISRAFSRGGIGQGAQNTEYDPAASAGIFSLFAENENEKKKKEKEQQTLNAF